ncbi:MAG TPA: ABC transporter permease [Jatrophihabitans sp.]|jgi:peptide/nickel transport system permease protein
MTIDLAQTIANEAPAPVVRTRGVLRRSLRLWRTRIGLAITVALVLVAIFGPYFAPHDPSALLGRPYQVPSPGLPLGADYLGQDVLSRFLYGGRSILLVSVISTVLGVGGGVLIGLWAALSKGWVDNALLRGTDILLAFPQILLALIVIATVGPKTWLIVLTVALTTLPRTVRVIRGAATSVVEREFVDAARANGDSQLRIALVEVLPNVIGALGVETTFRLTYAVQLIAALAFLGFAANPNEPNWGTMVSQNSSALTLQPNAPLVPAVAIALLTVGVGLVGDGIARAAAGIDRGTS